MANRLRMKVMRGIVVLVVSAVLALPGTASAGHLEPPLHVGLGVNVASVADVATAVALAHDHDFTARVTIAWSDGADTVAGRLEAIDAARDAGWRVIVAFRYLPPEGSGTPAGFADWAAGLAASIGPDVLFSVTSRVNALVPDPGSDAAQPFAFEALIEGVLAVKGAVPGAEVGFSWIATGVLQWEQAQWGRLGVQGGEDLAGSVDFVDLHLYPGTLSASTPYDPWPPYKVASDGVRATRVGMTLAGLHGDVAIEVGEFGFAVSEDEAHVPVFVNAHDLRWMLRQESAQARVLQEIIDGLEWVAESQGVRSAMWSHLADPADDCGLNRLCFGLLRPDRSERPAFDALSFAQSGRAAQALS